MFSGDNLFVLSLIVFSQKPEEEGQGDESSESSHSDRCLRQFLTAPTDTHTFSLKEKPSYSPKWYIREERSDSREERGTEG